MTLTDYTTYDDIRAILGVSIEELEDSTLALGVYSANLSMELEDVSSSLPGEYDTVKGIAQGSRTDVQRRLYDATRLFAAYAVAKQLGSGLPLFGPKDISDGKATVSRFADNPYRETLKKVDAYCDRTRRNLEEARAALTAGTAATVVRSLLSASGLSVDPVTGA